MGEMKLLQNMWRKKRSTEKSVTDNAPPEASTPAQAPAFTSAESLIRPVDPLLPTPAEEKSENSQALATTPSKSVNKNPFLTHKAESVRAPLRVTNPFLLRKERHRDEETKSKNEGERKEVCGEDTSTSEPSTFYMHKNSASNRAIYQFETGSQGDRNQERDVNYNTEVDRCQGGPNNDQPKPTKPPSAVEKQSQSTRAKYHFDADSEDEDEEIEVEITGKLLEEIEARKKRVYENLRQLKIIEEARGSEISSHAGCACTMNGNIDDRIVLNRKRLDRIR